MKAYICVNCAFSTIIKNRFEKCPICNNEFTQLTNKESKEFLNLNGDQRIQWVEDKIGHPIPYELNELRENYKNKKWQEIEQQEDEQSIKLSDALEHGYQKTNKQQVGNTIHNTGLHYCKKCGRRINVMPYNGVIETTCDYCKSEVYPVPKEYLDKDVDWSFKDKETEEYFVENFIKTAPEFDEYLFNHRDSDLRQRWAETEAALEHGKAVSEGRDKGNKFGVECPYCHATNVKRITASSKAVHTAVFGIFSMGRNSKNYHCNHCGSDF